MANRLLTLTLLTFVFFLTELVCMNFFGRLFVPNLLILLVIFVDLHLGVRFGLFVAVLSGILKDSFGAEALGVNLSAFIFCVYITTLLRRYFFYDMEFGFLRILMAFLMSLLNVLVVYLLISLYRRFVFLEVISFIIVPQVVATTLVAAICFRILKRCVLKLSV